MSVKYVTNQTALVLSIVILWLYIINKLTLYVHPRYELFTVMFALVSLTAHCISFFQQHNQTFKKTDLIIYAVIILAVLLPPSSLSTRTAENRTQQNQISNQETTFSSYDKFNQDFSYFDVADLSAILSNNPSSDQIVGKQASVEGFLFNDNQNQYYIARFKLSCCAVDATPLVVPVTLSNSAELTIGNWYKATGPFEINANASSDHRYAISVDSITPISEPEEPYVY